MVPHLPPRETFMAFDGEPLGLRISLRGRTVSAGCEPFQQWTPRDPPRATVHKGIREGFASAHLRFPGKDRKALHS